MYLVLINVSLNIDFSTSPTHQQWAEKANFIQLMAANNNNNNEGQKKLFKCRNRIFAGDVETTSLLSAPLLEPKLSTLSSNLNKNEQKFPEN